MPGSSTGGRGPSRPTGFGCPPITSAHRRHCKPILKRAGLPNLRLYDLRHSAATLLFAAGAPTKVVSEVLGHASVNLTQNTYIHVIPGMHQQGLRDMGAMLINTRAAGR